MHIAFLLAAATAARPGPAGYLHRMADALRQDGHGVSLVAIEGGHPVPDQMARQSARRAWRQLPAAAVAVIDGPMLPAFADLGDAVANLAVGLVHHVHPLERDLPERDRAALRERRHLLLPRLATVIATSPSAAERLRS